MLGRTFVIAAALVLLLAPAASAQQEVTETSMKFSTEESQTDWTVGIERGGSGFMFVRAEYCHKGPGLNPNEGQVTASIEILGTPDWVEMIPPQDVLAWTPESVHPSQEEKCLQQEWQLSFKITNNAPYGEQGNVDVQVTVQNGDTGTYKPPAEMEFTESIPVAVKEPEVDPITGGGGADDNDTADPNVDAKTEESPAPLPMVGILALVGLAALRRRRA